jgi:hypothetical protein
LVRLNFQQRFCVFKTVLAANKEVFIAKCLAVLKKNTKKDKKVFFGLIWHRKRAKEKPTKRITIATMENVPRNVQKNLIVCMHLKNFQLCILKRCFPLHLQFILYIKSCRKYKVYASKHTLPFTFTKILFFQNDLYKNSNKFQYVFNFGNVFPYNGTEQ